jgi:ubiquinone/menaquinone biosynthesis C-methylase UbiE
MFPALSPSAAYKIRALGPGERDLFVVGSHSAAYAMSLRHAKAYEFASEYAKNRTILDLGCGSGSGAVYLSRFGHVTAIDVEKELVKMLPSIWSNEAVEWQHFSGGTLPFGDARFDLITCFQVIEHISDQKLFLKEIRRVLRKNGTALITTPNRLLRLAPWQKPWNPYHFRELTQWQLNSLFRNAGFTEVRILGLQGIPQLIRPERKRCFKMMIGPSWMKLPPRIRGAIRAIKPENQSLKDSENASDEPQYGLESFWWCTRGVCRSLDLLGIGI